ncbi:MAG: sulfatase-like hydrolase/transferase, partial [Akkermansiaceae bacterium]|nr:sulfatase-like hydrolase/transferase [Akkermansiaceae bacterium]
MFRILAFLFSVGIATAKQPNIILIVTDDQSPVAGCYGDPVIKTPNLDALAKEGVRFTQAFATTASCSA